MVGLLIKDIRLFLGQRNLYIAVFAMAVLLTLTGQDVFFIISYCTMLCTFFTISTVSYDEFNHGYAFLFTMPITRKSYALEKYLFGALMGGSVWFVTMILGFLYSSVTDPAFEATEWLVGGVWILLVMAIMLCVMLPLQIKFGADKSRVVILGFVIVVVAGSSFFMKMLQNTNLQKPDIAWITEISMGIWLLTGAAVTAIAVVISILISIKILENKQF